MDKTNPYVAPTTAPESVRQQPGHVSGILNDAWLLFSKHFIVILAAVCSVWIPLELINSYLDYYVFDPEDLRSSFKLSQFFDNFIGIIATAAVISVGAISSSNGVPRFREILAAGFQAWPRLWWTRVLTNLTIIVCFLLLIVPGVYVAIRLCFSETVAVVEHISGPAAMRRSFELTRNKFWYIFRLCAALMLLLMFFVFIIVAPQSFFPMLDNWIIDACSQLICDIAAAYVTLCFYCGYRELSAQTA